MTHALPLPLPRVPRPLLWTAAAALGLWGLYCAVIFATGPTGLSRAAAAAAINVLPLAVLALGVQRVLGHPRRPQAPWALALLHGGLAIAFSLLWYAAVVSGLSALDALQSGRFQLRGFSGPALTWQCFQGLCLYALVAALSHAMRRAPAPSHAAPAAPRTASTDRYLVKVDDALIPIQAADVICLQGAHDYVQLTTPARTHLVRHQLAEFSARLDPARFLRIHRSIVINLDHVQRIEMIGGGKLRVRMGHGISLDTSRAGAKVLRAMTI